MLHLGDHNFIGGVDYLNADEFAKMRTLMTNAFLESDIPSVIGVIKDYFKYHNYSLWHLFKEEQQKILNQVLGSTMDDIETSFRQIYDHHYPLMQIKNEISLPLPRMLMTVVEFVLNRDISAVLEAEEVDIKRFKQLVEEMKRWSFKRDQANFTFLASQTDQQPDEAFIGASGQYSSHGKDHCHFGAFGAVEPGPGSMEGAKYLFCHGPQNLSGHHFSGRD